MANLSLRNLDTATLAQIKSSARRRRISVNQLIVDTLREHYAEKQQVFDDLDALAAAWSRADAKEFNAAVQPFAEIDSTLWAAEPRATYDVAKRRGRTAKDAGRR